MVDKLSVLRECLRVLKPGGSMAGYVIYTPANESPALAARANALGPTYTAGPVAPAALARRAGFQVITTEDVTPEFRRTAAALLAARREMADELRSAEGDGYYVEECTKLETMLTGVDEGLLRRMLIVTRK